MTINIGVPEAASPVECGRLVLRIARDTSLQTGLRAAELMRQSTALRSEWSPFIKMFAQAHNLHEVATDTLLKPFNEYMVLHLPIPERIRLLRQYYALLSEYAEGPLLRDLWDGRSQSLGAIEGKRERYILSVGPTQSFQTRKEGEVTLALRQQSAAQQLATLTFLLTRDENGHVGLMVGGVQGLRHPSAKEMIISATRDLFGLRPRDALLLAALAIAQSIGASEVWGVSTALHVHNARSERHRKRFYSDYDSFWVERGAHRNWPFGWALDVPVMPPSTGKTANGVRREAVKAAVWNLARQALMGTAHAQAFALAK